MIVFRIVCAILLAWAVNWSLSRDEAAEMLKVLPDMLVLGPVAGAIIGYVNLSVRQGWGFIVAFANGVWAGVLAILLYLAMGVAGLPVFADGASGLKTLTGPTGADTAMPMMIPTGIINGLGI